MKQFQSSICQGSSKIRSRGTQLMTLVIPIFLFLKNLIL